MNRGRSSRRRGGSLVRRRLERFGSARGIDHGDVGGRNYGKVDWRSLLFSIYVNNLSREVKKTDLWDMFGRFGRVVDVYFPKSALNKGNGSAVFAFVRYKLERDAIRAIKEGNGILIGNCKLGVSWAKYSWRDRKSVRNSAVNVFRGHRKAVDHSLVNGRSFKEVVVGDRSKLAVGFWDVSTSISSGQKEDINRGSLDRCNVILTNGSSSLGSKGSDVNHVCSCDVGLKTITLNAIIPEEDMVSIEGSRDFDAGVREAIDCSDPEAEQVWLTAAKAGLIFRDKDLVLNCLNRAKDGAGL
ncbi:hypothetical protein COLO4_05573 [Corchorus olitorius]|uniref:RRM domain-containing protein n=1 Tax=Corchorus olitorius TaxID=93759 RepID=A0A1R3KQL6_9ROSI|nr:hypothetical protein COLO4_05573 [Corchorus olitorius]